jgi:tryptophan synthase alpha chain
MSKRLAVFLTGGDPDIPTTGKLIAAAASGGADIIEIGIPFSDPIAEGPVIQAASERALKSGTTLDGLFEMVSRLGVEATLLFMGYYNTVFAYGAETFKRRCHETGVRGVILPDLPFEERGEFDGDLSSMVTPNSAGRAKMIARNAKGEFIYCVSSLGVTGMRENIDAGIGEIIRQIKTVTDIPCLVGFGISTPEQAAEMARISDGVIIGSKIVSLAHEEGAEAVKSFVKEIKSCINQS